MRNELFDYNDKTYDVGFESNNKVSLYVVRDKLSGLVISQIIQCQNDLIAMRGFKNFVDAKQKDEKDFSVYSLKMIGVLDVEQGIIEAAESHQEICDSRDNLEDIIKACTDYVLANVED